jgi:hypothetical protein
METSKFIEADEVVAILGIKKPTTYMIIRQLNDELKKEDFLTIAGRVSSQYFMERFYGFELINTKFMAMSEAVSSVDSIMYEIDNGREYQLEQRTVLMSAKSYM